jgi:hypothetical protein
LLPSLSLLLGLLPLSLELDRASPLLLDEDDN